MHSIPTNTLTKFALSTTTVDNEILSSFPSYDQPTFSY